MLFEICYVRVGGGSEVIVTDRCKVSRWTQKIVKWKVTLNIPWMKTCIFYPFELFELIWINLNCKLWCYYNVLIWNGIKLMPSWQLSLKKQQHVAFERWGNEGTCWEEQIGGNFYKNFEARTDCQMDVLIWNQLNCSKNIKISNISVKGRCS